MSPPQKPIDAIANSTAAVAQSVGPTNASIAVGTIPTAVKMPSILMRAWPRSASAPSHGAMIASTKLDVPLAIAEPERAGGRGLAHAPGTA